MDTVLYNKFTQHKDLKRELLATGDAELIEVQFLADLTRRPTEDIVYRTRTKIHSGGVGRMGKAGMSLGRHLDDCAKIYANGEGSDLTYDIMTLVCVHYYALLI